MTDATARATPSSRAGAAGVRSAPAIWFTQVRAKARALPVGRSVVTCSSGSSTGWGVTNVHTMRPGRTLSVTDTVRSAGALCGSTSGRAPPDVDVVEAAEAPARTTMSRQARPARVPLTAYSTSIRPRQVGAVIAGATSGTCTVVLVRSSRGTSSVRRMPLRAVNPSATTWTVSSMIRRRAGMASSMGWSSVSAWRSSLSPISTSKVCNGSTSAGTRTRGNTVAVRRRGGAAGPVLGAPPAWRARGWRGWLGHGPGLEVDAPGRPVCCPAYAGGAGIPERSAASHDDADERPRMHCGVVGLRARLRLVAVPVQRGGEDLVRQHAGQHDVELEPGQRVPLQSTRAVGWAAANDDHGLGRDDRQRLPGGWRRQVGVEHEDRHEHVPHLPGRGARRSETSRRCQAS